MREFPKLSLTSEWIENTLSKMTFDQKIAQLLHPCIRPSVPENERLEILGGIEPGGIFLFSGTKKEFLNTTQWLQKKASIPIIISSDLENGAGRMIKDATIFPCTMALGAANNEDYAYEMGKAAALEGRECGIHWSFGPVVDININPHNPITNTTSLGDDISRITGLSGAMIRGMQQNRLCSTAKHFPGGGLDDRDQHICNTINTLSMDQWFALSGRTFQEAIDLGVWSIMIGHISLPAWDAGDGKHIQTSTPATLSKKIITELLRKKMGFSGVIITDAMDMGGVTAWGPMEEIIPGAIEAGCDMILFSSAKRDFKILKDALKNGILTEARIEESVRRILALKEILGLHEKIDNPDITSMEKKNFQSISEKIAKDAITLVRDRNKILPLKLEKGIRLLSYHLRGDPETNVDTFDNLLQGLGVEVISYNENDIGKVPEISELTNFDVILINASIGPSWGTNRIRAAGIFMRDVWALITSHHPRLVFISYGSPYLFYDMPHLPFVINAYSPDMNTQKAVLNLLTGKIKATGTSPVNLDSPYIFKSAEVTKQLLKNSNYSGI